MKQSQLGVLREDPHDDVRALIENYTGEFRVSSLPQLSLLSLEISIVDLHNIYETIHSGSACICPTRTRGYAATLRNSSCYQPTG